jgi:hypothetical protein
MSIEVPSDIVHDIRQPVTGDSFGWEGLEPAAAKKSIVIHATASEAPDEDGFVIADYHVNHNGWGGVGVHFIATKDEYRGKPQFGLPAGAQLQYVGDLDTWRAGTVNQNPGRIHIEISGLFTPGNGIPSANQLRAVRKFIDWALSPNEVLPSLNFPSQVTYHNAVPGQNTACPGWEHPSFQAWFAYLQGGPFPDHLYAPEPPVNPPLPTPAPEPTPIPVTVIPEYQTTYREQLDKKAIARPSAVAISIDGAVIAQLTEGQIIDIAGYFEHNGHTYARTVYSATHNLWNGVDSAYFDVPTGQLSGPVPISTPEVSHPAPNPIVTDPTAVASGVTDGELQAATVPEAPKLTVIQLIQELIAQIIAKFIKRKSSK